MYRPIYRLRGPLRKDCVSVIRFSNTMQCEKYSGGDQVLWGKCANLYRVYKLMMISRVPGYGHLEYLVLEYHVNLNMLLLISIVGFLMSTFNWD